MATTDQTRPPANLDVAIVGGGVSGVYAAWRIREAGAKSKALGPLREGRPGSKLRIGLFEYGQAKGIAVGYLLFAWEQHGFRQAGNIKRALDTELYFYAALAFKAG